LFVAGEVREPLQETTHQVEDIVKSQVIELAVRAKTIANRRGSRALAPEDLIFLFRDDRPKVNRLKTFLSWMDVRKNTRSTTENEVQVSSNAPSNFGARFYRLTLLNSPLFSSDQLTTTLPRTIVKLPWELTSIYSDFLDEPQAASTSTTEYEDQLHQLYRDNLQRLKTADEVTKNMTEETYAYYSECRQASFTFKKGKRFRDFVNFSLYLEVKPSDEVIDILGFLAFEVVHNLGVQALQVKRDLEGAPPPPPPPSSAAPPPSTIKPNGIVCGLFASPPREANRTPLKAAHILEAYARIQRKDALRKTMGL
ncbi:transcription initiation factor IID, 18kD subunit-domain-containing protein, partial [Mrakia frigida]|uniref:transcriptional regulator SPT3 n=1 Tax=Mrakia frigida TaxID=29902 RepID=UPI003FCBF201